MYSKFPHSLFILVIVYTLNIGVSQNIDNGAINISLKYYNESQNTAQVFSTKTVLTPGATKEITISDVNRLIKYFIIQVHSFQTNTLLSNTTNFAKKTTVNGTNNGLVQQIEDLLRYKFYTRNENPARNVTVLILVVAYPDNVPIPGGCNMEFMVETAPYQRLNYSDNIVQVDAQSASLAGETCDNYVLSYSMHHLYLPELDFSEENYFSAVQHMATPENIEKYGTEMHKNIPNRELRRLYSAYRGTGAVYAIIVTFLNNQAAYVPIATYACDASNGLQTCDVPKLQFTKFMCGVMIFFGLFTCFFGHWFFKTSMLFVGILIGTYFSYMEFYYSELLTETNLLVTSMAVGTIVGLLWVKFWCSFGIPILSILFSLFALGFTVAAVLYYAALGDINIFQSDLNYWGFLTCITLLAVTVLIGFTHRANILACTILGACAMIISVDNYIGSNLKYIFINVLRRATVANFEYAVLSPPFQYRDATLSIIWMVVALMGLYVQLRLQRGRPPFPPRPSSCCSPCSGPRRQTREPDESTSLLFPAQTRRETTDAQAQDHSPYFASLLAATQVQREATATPSAPILVF